MIQSISLELVHHRQKRRGTKAGPGQAQPVQQAGFQTGTRTRLERNSLAFPDSPQFTWGRQATQVPSSPWSGRGIRVAVLDTGFDSTHPDFAGPQTTAQSVIVNEQAEDGHGTHFIGTATGTNAPASGPRYGIAYGAEIFVEKVLSKAESGSDSGIIAGINWAVANKVPIISMSLGADVPQVHRLTRRQQGNFGVVTPPVHSPHILSVAALEETLDVAFFSARSFPERFFPERGGTVDIAGPGFRGREL